LRPPTLENSENAEAKLKTNLSKARAIVYNARPLRLALKFALFSAGCVDGLF
jgi:hypothetical protein